MLKQKSEIESKNECPKTVKNKGIIRVLGVLTLKVPSIICSRRQFQI